MLIPITNSTIKNCKLQNNQSGNNDAGPAQRSGHLSSPSRVHHLLAYQSFDYVFVKLFFNFDPLLYAHLLDVLRKLVGAAATFLTTPM